MIYIVGGPARCGKTTLAARVRKEIDGQVLSADALTQALRDIMNPTWAPDLFTHVIDPIDEHSASEETYVRLRRRDIAMWRFYEGYFKAASHGSDDDMLLDGNAWPDSVATLKLPHKAVFLVDTSPDQAARLMAIRDSDSVNNWMKHNNYTDERIARWAAFNVLRSEKYIAFCQQHGYCYFDIATHGIKDAQQLAFEQLMEKAL